MRHGKKLNHLSRKAAHRKAMLANMACSLIEHKRIKTTLAKAKALRVYIEPLITKSKNDTTHSRRTVFSYLKQKNSITELFGDIASKVAEREGGYVRILKLSNRLGDNAQMAYIELVDYNTEYSNNKPKRKKARRIKKKVVETVNKSIEDAIIVENSTEDENVKDSSVNPIIKEVKDTSENSDTKVKLEKDEKNVDKKSTNEIPKVKDKASDTQGKIKKGE
tara:strand:+ start:1156 stop:1818 length:663 start_codon:yes stop_codon:yes gene_type:complete